MLRTSTLRARLGSAVAVVLAVTTAGPAVPPVAALTIGSDAAIAADSDQQDSLSVPAVRSS